MAATSIPTRSEIDVDSTWDLSLLYADDQAWEGDFEELAGRYQKIGDFKGRVGDSVQDLLATLEFEKSLDVQTERLYHFASLRMAEDASNNLHLDRIARMRNLHTRIREQTAFLTPEIMAISDEVWVQYIGDPALYEWRLVLEKVRRYKPHTLSEPEERLLALSSEPLDSSQQAFSQLTNVDMQFGKLEDAEGNQRELSQSTLLEFLNMPDRTVRKRAFHQFYAEFEEHKFSLATMLAGSVKADVYQARARNYQSALEHSLFHDNVSPEVYHGLIAAVRDGLQPLHDYYAVRKRALSLADIHHYDTYLPIISDIDRKTSWEHAVDLIEQALAPLGDEYTTTMAAGLRGRWADRYETKGKRSGAFSSSSYGNPPYILMNYKEDVFSDVYTLAHEAGHSMHSWYSQSHQQFQNYNYPILTAEVASTFNEELLTHFLLQQTSDPVARAYLISRQLDDIRGTLYRQTMFAEFELAIHQQEERGDALTLDWMKATYRSLLDAYFGQDFIIDDDLEFECLRIPHFYSAFYVYKYATGISAAISLADRVLNGGQNEVDDYLGFLKAGGSRYPLDTLARAGVDLTSAAPVAKALELFSVRVAEVSTLLEELPDA